MVSTIQNIIFKNTLIFEFHNVGMLPPLLWVELRTLYMVDNLCIKFLFNFQTGSASVA